MTATARAPQDGREATGLADVGVWGLGTMGGQLALNLAEHGFRVALHNRSHERVAALLAGERGRPWADKLNGTRDTGAFVAAIAPPRRILLMVPAGTAVDDSITELLPLLSAGDVVVDGGNSLYSDTDRRQRQLLERSVAFLGCGVSGGAHGARHGPSLMVGGDPVAYALMAPLLEAIAAEGEGGRCLALLGRDGAGHFAKMVHNGIEYADMQLLAEAYDLLQRGLGLPTARIAEIFAAWNTGPLESFLLELAARVARRSDRASGRPLLELVDDAAAQKGTGRWTVQAALDLGVAVPTLAAGVDARTLSAHRNLRSAAAAAWSGPDPQAAPGWLATALGDADRALDAVHDALHAARLVACAQGLQLVGAASDAHGWGTDRAELARIWTGGCILRARSLSLVRAAFTRDRQLSNLALDPAIAAILHETQPRWRALVAAAVTGGLPVAALASALSWYDTLRSRSLPTNLTQAQRDAFGAHGFRRRDRLQGPPEFADWETDPPRTPGV